MPKGEIGKLTPREAIFFRAILGGAAQKDAYNAMLAEAGRKLLSDDSAKKAGSRMLKRIKKKWTGRASWTRPVSMTSAWSASWTRSLTTKIALFACALLSFSPSCAAAASLTSPSTATWCASSQLPAPTQHQSQSSMPTIDLSRLPECINPVYYPHLFDDRRYNVFYGGAGSGKSYFVAERYVYRMLTQPGRNILGVRKVDKSNRDSTYALMMQVLNSWGLRQYFTPTVSPLSITCKHNGNQMLFRGLDDAEKLKSITFISGVLTDIWVEEASELTPGDDLQLRTRLRGYTTVPKQVTYTFNPISALHWLKARFFDSPLSADRALVLKTTYKDNAWLSADDRAELEALKDEDLTYYMIYALGEWGVIGNVVFSNYVIEDFPYDYADFDAVYQGQDYGFNHPFAFELVGLKDGELYVFDEVYRRGCTNGELISGATAYFTERGILDRVRQARTTADSAEPDRIKEWRQAGWNVAAAQKGKGSEKYGIDYLKHHRIHIHKTRCPGIASEVPIYKYREDKFGNVLDEFVDFKNDAIDALRYATESMHKPRGAHVAWA